jgi:hypothetical protein
MTRTYTKIQARQYKASTGEILVFYTSKQYGEKNSKGWYISRPDGFQSPVRFDTLRDVKMHLEMTVTVP